MPGKLNGKVAIVTGASRGLGRRIAGRFLDAGASLVVCARDETPLEEARSELLRSASPSQQVEAIAGDVSDPECADRVGSLTIERFGRIDVLVNNAAVLGPIGRVEEVDWLEWMKVLHVNLFGSVLMVRTVLPAMRARCKGKIIQLSGGGATSPRPMMSAYAASKAAVVRFVETVAEEVRGTGICVNALAPGALNTRMLDQVLSAGPEKAGRAEFEGSVRQKETGGAGLDGAATLATFLASEDSDGITGRLISAVWDDWESWPAHRDELAATDAFTLRRVTGRDRGLGWGEK